MSLLRILATMRLLSYSRRDYNSAVLDPIYKTASVIELAIKRALIFFCVLWTLQLTGATTHETISQAMGVPWVALVLLILWVLPRSVYASIRRQIAFWR